MYAYLSQKNTHNIFGFFLLEQQLIGLKGTCNGSPEVCCSCLGPVLDAQGARHQKI